MTNLQQKLTQRTKQTPMSNDNHTTHSEDNDENVACWWTWMCDYTANRTSHQSYDARNDADHSSGETVCRIGTNTKLASRIFVELGIEADTVKDACIKVPFGSLSCGMQNRQQSQCTSRHKRVYDLLIYTYPSPLKVTYLKYELMKRNIAKHNGNSLYRY